jgi:hypothetical protein
VTEHPSPIDRLEARLDAQAARIDELYRLLQAADRPKSAAPHRRPRGRRERVTARP